MGVSQFVCWVVGACPIGQSANCPIAPLPILPATLSVMFPTPPNPFRAGAKHRFPGMFNRQDTAAAVGAFSDLVLGRWPVRGDGW